MPIGLSGMKTGGQIEAPGGGAADESGPAQIHVADGRAHVGGRAQVQEGEFATKWILENKAGRPGFSARRRVERGLLVEKVGGELREKMSWSDGK